MGLSGRLECHWSSTAATTGALKFESALLEGIEQRTLANLTERLRNLGGFGFDKQ
jgi:hypothetical protein